MTNTLFAEILFSIFRTFAWLIAVLGVAFLPLVCATTMAHPLQAQGSTFVSTPHARMVTVEKGVDLEVLDWGGTGRPLILLQGLGGVAHDYDQFAQQFT